MRSLCQSLGALGRYLLYGIQIAKRGRIDDFADGNEYYHRIMSTHHQDQLQDGSDGAGVPRLEEEEDIERLREEYKQIAKDIHAQFNQLLPPKAQRPRKPRRRKGKEACNHPVATTDTDSALPHSDSNDMGLEEREQKN
jgi:hypothetical protein